MRSLNKSGFSIVEMILVVSILLFLSSISFGVYRSYADKNDLDQLKQLVADSVRQVRLKSCLSVGDSPWGLKILSDGLLSFKGSSYTTRSIASDQKTYWPIKPITYDVNHDEVVFPNFCTTPMATSSLIFVFKGTTVNININEQGIVNY